MKECCLCKKIIKNMVNSRRVLTSELYTHITCFSNLLHDNFMFLDMSTRNETIKKIDKELVRENS